MQDILLNSDFDLVIQNGDFVVGDSDVQHKTLLLYCVKGDFKDNPDVCVGIENYLESEDESELIREVKAQFRADGMNIKDDGSSLLNIVKDAKYL